MRIFITVLFFIFSIAMYSQKVSFEKPNYKKIKRVINKKKSPLYYTRLYKKYTNINSKMTLKEKRHLYYGFIFQKRYDPFGINKYHDSLRLYAHKKHTKKSIQKMLFFSKHILQKNPFNIEVITYKASLLRKTNNKDALKIAKKQLQIIYDAINSSGDGLTSKTAYHVIFRKHKSDFLKHKNLKFNGFKKTIDKFRVEYLNVTENKKNIRGIYFNVSAFKINLKSKK